MPDPASFLDLIGGFPDRPELDVEELSTVRADGYQRTLVEYSTVAGERVQAHLLIPGQSQARRRPTIIAIHQDGGTRPYAYGKSEVAGLGGDPGLAYGHELCKRGYIVICPDRFGFESRSLANSAQAAHFSQFPIQGTENGIDYTEDLYKGAYANRLLFNGWTQLGLELYELSRAVDYLSERQDVDADRIGAIGHSAGGLLMPYLMFVDERVKVGAASCGTWRFAEAFRADELRPMQGFGGMLAVPGMGNWGDTDDILAGIAPRPFWEAVEEWEPRDTEALIGKAKVRYAELGQSERFRYLEHDKGHTFPAPLREEAYAWFDRWLLSDKS